jgi:hypothetical protein
MMNSLYGKFAADPSRYREYIIVPPDEGAVLMDEDSPYVFAGEIGPWLLGERPLDDGAMRYYNVATGASITGYVRAMLWRAIHSSQGVLYADTDTMACRTPGESLKQGEGLGEWKCEGHFDRAGIAGKKLYIFRGVPGEDGRREYKTASKGVRLTHAELWRVAHGGTVDYESTAPTFSVHKAPGFIQRSIVRTA